MTSPKFDALFGGPPRKADAPVTQRDMDLAASIQNVTEEIMLRCARHAHAITGMKDLCLAGGVALNCVGNGRILREGPFDDVWIQPAAGDAGGALGVALFIWHQLLDRPRTAQKTDSQSASLLGPAFGDDAIEAFLDRSGRRVHAYRRRNADVRSRRRRDRRRQGHRVVPGPDGVRAARARRHGASSAMRATRGCSRSSTSR